MVWYILASLLLLLVQGGLVGSLLRKQVGSQRQMGARDDLPEPTPELGRARRALANLQETLPIFLTVGLLLVIYRIDGWLAHLGAILYLAGRVAHLVCYVKGLNPWRSIAFGVAMLGLFCLVGALVAGIV